jgi:hypothetical protein
MYLRSMDAKLDIPFERLLRIIQHLTPSQRQKVRAVLEQKERSGANSERILSFGGAFADMSSRDYAEFAQRLKDTRTDLFDRGTKAP